jgi:hypothetical protein
MLYLKQKSLNWALKHSLKFGDTDVFPIPFEFQALKADWPNVSSNLIKEDLDNWKTRPLRSLLSPKGGFGFRIITQLDPLDFLVFAALIYEIGGDLEKERVPENAEIVFSHRMAPEKDGRLYSDGCGYRQFQQKANEIVKTKEFSHVAVTDIADFYPRIYAHRLENALASCTTKNDHVRVIKKMLSGWNETESHGIPVGSAPARLLAEITINDVDRALIAHQIKFIRYIDDYRLFAKSYSEAFRQLAILAQILYENHGLTLQPQKTSIHGREAFKKIFLSSPEDNDLDELQSDFEGVLDELGVTDPYAPIDYDDLSEEEQELIDSLNLKDLFKSEIEKNDPDLSVVRFVLRRMGQLGNDALVELALSKIEEIHPAFADVMQYLHQLRSLLPEKRKELGKQILDLLETAIFSELPYYRMWALSMFTKSSEWDNEDRFQTLLNETTDSFTRRELILAMGRAGQSHWFQSKWRHLFDEGPWCRRALLAGASCLPGDGGDHWYRSVMPRLDTLERAVVKWAKANPFA